LLTGSWSLYYELYLEIQSKFNKFGETGEIRLFDSSFSSFFKSAIEAKVKIENSVAEYKELFLENTTLKEIK
jgi:hypothetical protein